jgi:integrase
MDKLKSAIVPSLYFDKRKAKKNGKFPLRIQLFNSKTRKQKYFPTNYEFTAEEYVQIHTLETSSDKKWHLKLSELQLKVKETIEQTNPFSFDEFEKKLYDRFTANDLVKLIFESKIKLELANEKINTANVYIDTVHSIEKYLISKKSNIDDLSISEIDSKWIQSYNDYLKTVRANSISTIGIRMRNLRTIWNIALKNNLVNKDCYPFGKNKFKIKTQTKAKFVLFKDDIKKLIATIPETKSQEIAKDYWLLSYYCCGLNLTDFALFKKQNLNKQNIKFFRKKSIETKNDDIEIVIPLRDVILEILEKYIDTSRYYLFDIIEENDDAVRKREKIKNFNDVINKNIKKLCNGMFDENFTYYTARHSWATNSIIAGAPLVYIQQQLGHTDPKTTMNYIATLPSIASKPYVDNFFEQLLDI